MEQELKADWYPIVKARSAPDCPPFINLELFESEQVQEVWAIEGDFGPEVMRWRDGHFVDWFPKTTIKHALETAAGWWSTRTGERA